VDGTAERSKYAETAGQVLRYNGWKAFLQRDIELSTGLYAEAGKRVQDIKLITVGGAYTGIGERHFENGEMTERSFHFMVSNCDSGQLDIISFYADIQIDDSNGHISVFPTSGYKWKYLVSGQTSEEQKFASGDVILKAFNWSFHF
jgi:hypothetical protein